MKRLIKKAEIFSGINYNDNYYEIFKNPTANEWNIVQSYGQNIRGLITLNGDLYIWLANILHEELKKYLNLSEMENISLIVENSQIDTLLTYILNIEEFTNIIINCKSLFNYFNRQSIISNLVVSDKRMNNIPLGNIA